MKQSSIRQSDEYEQETDRVAEQMRTPEVQRKPTWSYGEPNWQQTQPSIKHKRLQSKSVRPSETKYAIAPPIAYKVLRSPGHSLDATTRAYFESRLGHDFNSVRVHTDAKAALAARSVQARAYTLDQHIVFGREEYQPGTVEGTRLLAHELTHVVQQRHGVSLDGSIGQLGDVYERHADAVADAVVADRPAETLLARGPSSAGNAARTVIQRQHTPAATTSEPVDEKVEKLMCEGDLTRDVILESARKRRGDQTTIVSAEDIELIQKGYPDKEGKPTKTPVKNYTTCIEFAEQTFADAMKARSKELNRSSKETRRAGRLLTDIRNIYNKEFSLEGQIDVLMASIKRNKEQITENPFDRRGIQHFGFQTRQEKAEKKKEELEAEKKKLEKKLTGELEVEKGLEGKLTGETRHDIITKQQIMQIKQQIAQTKQQIAQTKQQITGIEHVIRQLTSVIDKIGRDNAKLQTKIDSYNITLDDLKDKDDALIRFEIPLTLRPKPGDYIMLGAGSAQPYGVSTASTVTLTKGSFKHIAVFEKSEEVKSPNPNETWEKWFTIDGGGVTPSKKKALLVCISDGRVNFPEARDPWSASKTSLIGWIDIKKLVDSTGVAKNAGTAPTTP